MEDVHPGIHVFVLGLRGLPAVQGGIETHAEHLLPLISERHVRVTCATRSRFHDPNLDRWRNVRLLPIWAPRSRYLEAIVHSFLAVARAAISRPDIVHIHGIGPALVAPLARLFGLRVVVTHHGPDYDREKWNRFAKAILRLGEWAGMKFANERIVISSVIADKVAKLHGVKSVLIPNGVALPKLDADPDLLRRFALDPGRYVLLVSRMVPEKRHFDLIQAFEQSGLTAWKLALVGDADHPDSYSQSLKETAASNDRIVLTGFLSGAELRSLYQHAGLFVLPSSHEGLPIALLEALSFGIPCVASSIPANLSVGLPEDSYYPLGDLTALAERIRASSGRDWTDGDAETQRKWVRDHFNWQTIADQTVSVYRTVIQSS